MSHWTGTLDLVRTVLEGSSAWAAACAPAATVDRVVVGVGGHPWEGTFLRQDGAAKPLALPLAQIALGEPEWEPEGHKRWVRAGSATVDVVLAGGPNPEAYRRSVQLAEDLLDAYRAAADAGTLLADRLRVSGPPLYLPTNLPSPFAGNWAFQLTITWEINR